MNTKQKFLSPKSLAIGSLLAVTSAFSAAIVSPLSAKAQVTSPVNPSPVSPVTTTSVVDFGNFNLSGTSTTSGQTSTTTSTTTTTNGTTTTTTTTVSSTQNTATSQTSSTQQTSSSSSSSTNQVATETRNNETSNQISTTSVSTGLEATTGVSNIQTTNTQSVAVVISISEQYATATGIQLLFISDLASELGVNGDVLVGTLIFENVRGLRGNRQAALAAFRNALKKAGIFEFASFNNEALAQFFTSYASAEEVAAAFNGLSEARILLLSRGSKFFAAKGLKFRLFRVRNISFAQYFVYKITGIRAITFPAPRNND